MGPTDGGRLGDDLPADLVQDGLSISGLFDLSPLIGTGMNKDLRLDAESARRVSPLFEDVALGRRLDAWVGAEESNEFLRQSSEIAQAWGRKGVRTEYVALPGTNHFTVLDPLADPESEMTRRLVERAETAPHLHLDMSGTEVREAVSEMAGALNQRFQEALVSGVIDQARSGGRGVLGRDATVDALRGMRVDTLLLSRSVLRDDPELADRCVGAALAQDAEVEEVSGPGSDRLDTEGKGMGARLRYRLDDPQAAPR